MLVDAIDVQTQTGGNLAKILDHLAGTIKARRSIQRKVRSLTGEARMSGWVIGILPVALGAFIMTTQPQMRVAMLTTRHRTREPHRVRRFGTHRRRLRARHDAVGRVTSTVIVIALLVSGALFALGFALLDKGDDMKRRLAELERNAPDTDRGDRIVRSLVDEKQRVVLSNRFAEAGWYKTTVVSFTFTRIGLAAAVGISAGLAAGLIHTAPLVLMVMAGAGVVAGFIAPSFVLDGAVPRARSRSRGGCRTSWTSSRRPSRRAPRSTGRSRSPSAA